jgi:O-antigen ligase
VRETAAGLATLATAGGALLVLLIYVPSLQAPFLVPKFAALELAASVGLVAFAMRRAATGGARWAGWNRGITAGAWLVLATTALSWVAASHGPLGAPYATDAMARWAALFGMACAASVVDEAGGRWRVFDAITIAAAAVAAIGLLQHIDMLPLSIPIISTPGSTFGNRNPAGEAMAMALPFGVVAARRAKGESRAILVASVALELLFLAVTRARGAWIGGASGLAVLAWSSRARISRAGVAVALAAIVAAGAAASIPGRFNPRDAGDAKRYAKVVEVLQEGLDTRSTALRTRLGLWRRTASMISDHPLLGVGPGNWPVAFPRYAEPGAMRDGVLTATLGPRQAHDDLLERMAETGLPGLLALGLLVVSAAKAARDRLAAGDEQLRDGAQAAAASLAALAAISLGSFPLEMPATIALAGIALGFVAGDARAQASRPAASESTTASSRPATPGGGPVMTRVIAGVAVCLVAFAAIRAERAVRGSRWLGVAERAMRADRGAAGASAALPALKEALEATPASYRAALRTSQMLLREARSVEAARAARDALAIEPYAPDTWTALAAAELESGDATAARRDAGEALHLLEDDPLALSLRARAARREGDEDAAKADQDHLRALADHSDDAETSRAAKALLDRIE